MQHADVTVDAEARPLADGPRPIDQHAVRAEIQFLRAIAVGAVVIYHLWPLRLPGGYVGVDIFFAISGFLITGQLLREVERTGTVRVGAFWARRIRRLLPASLLVLLVIALGTVTLLDERFWTQIFREIGAGVFYVENWVLAQDAVAYLAADNVASPVQHYWSLSVEEQFYVAWPLLMLLALAVVRMRGVIAKRAIVFVLAVVFVCSATASVWLTATQPELAYFSTFTRAWEFAAGGLLAALPFANAPRGPAVWRAVASWAGLAMIVAACLLFDERTPFPSWWAAVPVAGALVMIAAGSPKAIWSPTTFGALRPVQWLGDVSYSAYLWHWPLLIFIGLLLPHDLNAFIKLGILAATLLLAWAMKRFVEDPVRRSPLLVRAPVWRTYAMGAICMAVVFAVVGGGTLKLAADAVAATERAEQLEAANPQCFGAAAADFFGTDACDVTGDQIVPVPALARQDRPDVGERGCFLERDEFELRPCVVGDVDSDTVVVLIGDSHGANIFPAMMRLAEENGWQLRAYLKNACPFTAAEPLKPSVGGDASACPTWNDNVVDYLESDDSIDLVLATTMMTREWRPQEGYTREEAVEQALSTRISELERAGVPLVLFNDTPRVTEFSLSCVNDESRDPMQCTTPREEAVINHEWMREAVERAGVAVPIVDVTDRMCTADQCPGVIGAVAVYRDTGGHITATFARTLAPYIEAQLPAF